MSSPILALVVPCYNEELVIAKTIDYLSSYLESLMQSKQVSDKSYIVFVDDGSHDQTWNIIRENSNREPVKIKGIKLAKNFGHQYALLAGLKSCINKCDCSISIDADLQQEPEAIVKFLTEFSKGNDIVFGVRNDRKTDSFMKKFTAGFFYSLMKTMGVKLVRNHADYRLVSNKVLNVLDQYTESNLFLRGVFSNFGFKTSVVLHEVRLREAGESKYSVKKMLALAFDGITSFSTVPIKLITACGFLTFIFSFLMICYVILMKLLGKAVVGWASTLLPIYFIGGIQLLSLGLIGEYVGKIYKEVKRRPNYVIEEEIQ